MQAGYDGQTVGIGVEIQQDASGYLKVVEVYEDGPAAAAEMAVGDLIVQVDDLEITAGNYEEAIAAMAGEEGSTVRLLVRRELEEEEIEITRQRIDVQSVKSQLLADGVGYVRITAFNANTADQFKRAVETLEEEGANAFVFDVRENLGGLLDAVVEMLDYLLPEGTLVTIEERRARSSMSRTRAKRPSRSPSLSTSGRRVRPSCSRRRCGITTGRR